MTTDDATEVLTLRVAGERFGLSPATLRDMAQRGELARAHKRTGASGEEWVVPALTVEALAAARSLGSNGHPPSDPAGGSPRRRRPLLPRGVMATVVLSLLAVTAVVAVLAATSDDAAEPAASGDVDDARVLLGATLDEHLPEGDAVGLLGDGAEALVEGRPAVALPDEATPPIVVLAGEVGEPSDELAAQIRDQGTLILTLSVPGGAEVWELPDAFTPTTATPTTLSPPSSAPPSAPEPSPPTAPPAPDPAEPPNPPVDAPPAGDTAVVAAGEGFWDVAEQALEDQLGRPATDAEVIPYWEALIDANQDQLPDPGNADLLYTGTVLVLPVA